MRCAIYSRVSTKDKTQDNENQLIPLRKFATSQQWEIVAEFNDKKSGKNFDRPQFKKMLDSASRREFDVLLFWSLDRLSREGTLATLTLLQRLESYGLSYRSYTESYVDTANGAMKDIFISIASSLAKLENVRKSERMTAWVEKKREMKQRIGRKPLNLDVAKVNALRRDGLSLRQIADRIGCSVGKIHAVLAA